MQLPLNSFDRALIVQTWPGRPMSTHHVLETRAPFAREALALSVGALADDLPTLRSRVRLTPFRVTRFAPDRRRGDPGAPGPELTFLEEATDLDSLGWWGRGFDLEAEAPMRVLHAPRRGGGYLLALTLHHSVTDGVGALALLDALLRRYGRYAGEPVGPEAPLSVEGGRLSTLLRRGGWALVASLVGANLRGAGRFGLRRATLLEDRGAPVERVRGLTREVPLARWSALASRARALGCTRNDLVLAAILRASRAARRARGEPDEPFRVLMPTDLRDALGIGRTLQNHLGVVEADVSVAEVDSPDLPVVLSPRLKQARALERALETPFALGVLGGVLPPRALRGLFRWVDQRPGAFMFSFLYSHIPVREGLAAPASLGLERVYCASVLPEQPGVGFTVTALPERVTLTMMYPHPRISPEGAEALCDAISLELQGFLEEVSG